MQLRLQSEFSTADLVIGVTGHRNIESNNPTLLKQAKSALTGFLKSTKTIKTRPWVLSALAEGGDRLLTNAAMEICNARLLAVLPMSPKEYKKDFQDEKSWKEFELFLDKAETIIQAPIPKNDDWKKPGLPRDNLYAWVGSVISFHSDVLLAIWDRQPAKGLGGTAQVVSWFERDRLQESISTVRSSLPLRQHKPERTLLHICP